MIKALAPLAALLSTIGFAMAQTAPPNVVKELAPSGTLRAALNFGNTVLAQRDPAGGAPRGVSAELARELAKRLGVPIAYVGFDAAGKVFEALDRGEWDIAFLAIDPARATGIDFTPPYVVIEGAYMVPVDSPLKTNEEVDRAGVRIVVGGNSAYDLYLKRTIKHATLVRSAGGATAPIQMFLKEKIEVVAGVKQPLVAYAKTDPNVRMIEGRFMEIEQAMGTPKGRAAGLAYLRTFIEEMKASGFVAQALAASGQTDAAVAPAAK
jgi:polar amino acid transport system substrate-binding protein